MLYVVVLIMWKKMTRQFYLSAIRKKEIVNPFLLQTDYQKLPTQFFGFCFQPCELNIDFYFVSFLWICFLPNHRNHVSYDLTVPYCHHSLKNVLLGEDFFVHDNQLICYCKLMVFHTLCHRRTCILAEVHQYHFQELNHLLRSNVHLYIGYTYSDHD